MHTVLALHGMASLARSVAALTGRLAEWNRRARQRHALAELDDRLLEDIGLTRDVVWREVAKSPWQE